MQSTFLHDTKSAISGYPLNLRTLKQNSCKDNACVMLIQVNEFAGIQKFGEMGSDMKSKNLQPQNSKALKLMK